MTFRAGLMAVLALITLASPVRAGQHMAPQLRIDGSGGVDTLGDTAPGTAGTPVPWRACNWSTVTCAALPSFLPIAGITGGTINGTAVGSTTPAAGTFTAVTAPVLQAPGAQVFKSNGTEFLRGFDAGGGRPRVWGNFALPGDSNAQTWLNNAQFVIASHGYNNAVAGYVDNDLPANTLAFPTALSGIAYLHAAGSQAFGNYSECHLTTTGVCTNEIDVFNDTGIAGPTSYPFNRAIGTTQRVSVALTVAGDSATGLTSVPSAAGIEIGQGGVNGSGGGFQFGIALAANGIKQWTLYQDVQGATGPNSGIYTGYNGQGYAQIWKYGVAVNPNYVALALQDQTAALKWGVRQSGQMDLNGPTSSVVGVAGAAQVLPANPTGYFFVNVAGNQKRVPYYE